MKLTLAHFIILRCIRQCEDWGIKQLILLEDPAHVNELVHGGLLEIKQVPCDIHPKGHPGLFITGAGRVVELKADVDGVFNEKTKH